MDDDFNTPEAVAVLMSLAGEINVAKDKGEQERAAALAAAQWFRLAGPEGQSQSGPRDTPSKLALSEAQIDARIAARVAARREKNFAESDRIRDELAAAGVILEDKPGGQTAWRRK